MCLCNGKIHIWLILYQQRHRGRRMIVHILQLIPFYNVFINNLQFIYVQFINVCISMLTLALSSLSCVVLLIAFQCYITLHCIFIPSIHFPCKSRLDIKHVNKTSVHTSWLKNIHRSSPKYYYMSSTTIVKLHSCLHY